jgi:hypothetical protein
VKITREEREEFLEASGYREITWEDVPPHPAVHYGCGGSITRIGEGSIYSSHARCEQCLKEGEAEPACDDDEGWLFEQVEVDDGKGGFLEYWRQYYVFGDEPNPVSLD